MKVLIKKKKFAASVSLGLFVLSMFLPTEAYSFKYKNIDIRIRGTAGEKYDDNITYDKDNRKNDLITDLSVGLGGKYEGKIFSFDFIGNVTQQIFAKNNKYNNTAEDLTANLLTELSKFDRIFINDIFTHTYEPRSFEEELGRPGGIYSYYRNNLKINYIRDITEQLSITGRYGNEINNISREDLKDSYVNSAGVEGDYFFSTATMVLLSYDFSNRKFIGANDASTNRLAGGLRQYLTKQLYFDGKAGLDFTNSYDNKNYFSPVIQVSLTDDINDRTKAGIAYLKQYYTNSYNQNLFNYWQMSGFLNAGLFKRLSCSLNGFYSNGEYVDSKITENLRGFSTALTYDITDNLKGTLSYSYSDKTSDVEAREYAKNTVFLKFTMEF